jgi:archaemetzincin
MAAANMKDILCVFLIASSLLFSGCKGQSKGDNNRKVKIFAQSADSRVEPEIDNSYFEALRKNDVNLEEPRSGEWLYEHKETGQNFQEYKSINPVTATDKRRKIYLQPIGDFSEKENNILRATTDYLHLFFQLDAILLDEMPDSTIPETARRTRGVGWEQLLATYINDTLLKQNMPEDAVVMMAFTKKDLYPSEDWNYVFGLSTIKDRVGVTSIYRYATEKMDNIALIKCLERLIKTSSHEIGHMFSLYHCTYALCLMNGTNSLGESDRKPNRLCSLCLKKLTWDLQLNNTKRLESLSAFFQEHGLINDYNRLMNDKLVLQN